MHDKVYGNAYWSTMVYVDSYENSVLRGWFCNPFLEGPQNFKSLSDFIIMMEAMLDTMCLPQSYSASRSFRSGSPRPLPQPAGTLSRGEKATFCLSIRFRQNSSWQGSITWLENGSRQSFRSVLELIVLMDSALRELVYPEGIAEKAAMA